MVPSKDILIEETNKQIANKCASCCDVEVSYEVCRVLFVCIYDIAL